MHHERLFDLVFFENERALRGFVVRVRARIPVLCDVIHRHHAAAPLLADHLDLDLVGHFRRRNVRVSVGQHARLVVIYDGDFNAVLDNQAIRRGRVAEAHVKILIRLRYAIVDNRNLHFGVLLPLLEIQDAAHRNVIRVAFGCAILCVILYSDSFILRARAMDHDLKDALRFPHSVGRAAEHESGRFVCRVLLPHAPALDRRRLLHLARRWRVLVQHRHDLGSHGSLGLLLHHHVVLTRHGPHRVHAEFDLAPLLFVLLSLLSVVV